jgi:hypothetical protein
MTSAIEQLQAERKPKKAKQAGGKVVEFPREAIYAKQGKTTA